MSIPATQMRPGMIIKFKDELHLVFSVEHRTPGNLRAFIQAKLRNVRTGAMFTSIPPPRSNGCTRDSSAVELRSRIPPPSFSVLTQERPNVAPVGSNIVAAGEISALVYVVGKPALLFQALTGADNLHFVPVRAAGDLRETYRPASLTSNDYPALLGPGEPVETVSVGTELNIVQEGADGPPEYARPTEYS